MKIYYMNIKNKAINIYSVPHMVFIGYLVETGKLVSHHDENGEYVEFLDLIPFKNSTFPSFRSAYYSNINCNGYTEKFSVKDIILNYATSKIGTYFYSNEFCDNSIAMDVLTNELDTIKVSDFDDMITFGYRDPITSELKDDTLISELNHVNEWISAKPSELFFNAIGSVALKAFYVNSDNGIHYIDNGYISGYSDHWMSDYESDEEKARAKTYLDLLEKLLCELDVKELFFEAHDVYNVNLMNNASEYKLIKDGCRWDHHTEEDSETKFFIFTNDKGHKKVHYDIIKCRTCGEYHKLSYTEMQWLDERGYKMPSRCRNCRAKEKERKE